LPYSKKKLCDCRPKILLVDDLEYNLLPLRLLLKKMHIDRDILNIVVSDINEFTGLNKPVEPGLINRKKEIIGNLSKSEQYSYQMSPSNEFDDEFGN
jgi:hypothetical protein